MDGSTTELTDYYTVLVTLMKVFVSTVQVGNQAVQGVESSMVKEKGMSKKELAALIGRTSPNQSFINGTSSISLGDLYVYFSLKGDEDFASDSEWFTRWFPCVSDFVGDAVNSPVGFSDPKVIGKVAALAMWWNEPKKVDNSFVDLGSAS
eukprot:CAMPEP_0118634684 /NCGR_PEP_ID=MMETSP0785-20121206/1679_1 /TAXON_ID=91992 /ORGANISM="Bolidomonas pacifica, Strain CCMP 1866" /LENGTH=149 /DNA_ID=CAMNT_0006525677 /DNA_START=153 /DNA_END=599 /DNA_ORIENTATION=+